MENTQHFPHEHRRSRRGEGHAHRGGRGIRGGRGHRGGPGRARRGDVRLAALLLIAEEPRNGYQVIQELADRTDGRWKPSPGAIYPALAQLEDEGLIRPADSGSGKAFEITEEGRAQADAVEQAPWDRTAQDDDPAFALAQAYKQTWHAVSAVSQTGDAETIAAATSEVEELRRRLFQLLAEQR